MKFIILREKGARRVLQFGSSGLVAGVGLSGVLLIAGTALLTYFVAAERIGADRQRHWHATIDAQQQQLSALQQRNQAQNAAVGRQLAAMQARLLRMEAMGAHMADVANLEGDEFDFSAPPAQGGPETGVQRAMNWSDLGQEIAVLSHALERRELELSQLEEIVLSEEMTATSRVQGRPVTWGWMSSPFGHRVDPISGKNAWHAGVDFAGRQGSDVIAVASGIVTFAGERHGYGMLVEISHSNGYMTRYGHHESLHVTAGDVVKKGAVIGTMGSSGRSTGPHVHFEVLKNGHVVDPTRYVSASS